MTRNRTTAIGVLRDARANPVVVDEYVMKSELPERGVPVIERTTRPHGLAPRSNERCQRSRAAA